ncbi:MAG: endolytic transglycosylase MltG [Mariprofundaceae bacterium]|nr:endolytic transglycosylase MltG [Mariprofundaceae bacterium]
MFKRWSWLKKGVLCCMMLILVLAVYGWQVTQQTLLLQQQQVLIPAGSSSVSIGQRLAQQQVISSAQHFRWLTRLTAKATSLKPGLYIFEGELSMWDVLNIISKGEVQQFKVTIPEGLRCTEMIQLLAKRTQTEVKQWQEALLEFGDIQDIEGLFLPETYQYTQPISAKRVLQQMHRARAQVEADLAAELGWSEVQIRANRIMASIIEKETALPHERVWVSAAIHNRLRLGMPLQMDPTVIYGIYRTQGSFSGNLRRQDLRSDSPWNTYTRSGLPLSPIANPGAASLRAAAYPADVDYLYFVADGTGGHAFAATLAQHNANVRQWIQIERNKAN